MDLMFKVFKAVQKRSKETHNRFVLKSEIQEAVPECDTVYMNFLILSKRLEYLYSPQDPQYALLPPAEEYMQNAIRQNRGNVLVVITIIITTLTLIAAIIAIVRVG